MTQPDHQNALDGGARAGAAQALWSRVTSGQPRILRAMQGFVFVALLLIALSVWYSLRQIDTLQSQIAQLEHAQHTQVASNKVLSIAQDLETGQRGFLLTGDRAYLAPFELGSANIGGAMDDLAALVQDAPDQRPRVARARQLVAQKLEELRTTIAAHADRGPDAALELVRSGAGKRIMDALRETLSEVDAEEARVVASHAADIQPAVWWLSVILLVRATFLIVLLAVAWSLNVSLSRRQRELLTSRTLLATTLSSIGDGVVVTDAHGIVTFLNGEAERLTQWSSTEAAGRPLTEVFRIVNETTRQPVESPVDKVLRLGTVVGLANHTILIGRKGAEVPIDDSAAPIRLPGAGQSPATLQGVVLVFRDFTEHKHLEQEILENQRTLEHQVEERSREIEATHGRLRAAERMAAMGTLAAGLGHDLSNLILPMQMRLETLQVQNAPPELSESLDAVSAGLLYLRRLASGLRQMAADPSTPPPPQGIELRHWWADARGMIASALPRNVELKTNIPTPEDSPNEPALPRVLISSVALTQAVFNLVQNAGEAIGSLPGGRVTITVEPDPMDPERTALVVSDNGAGMSPEVAARCFEPYFSTKGRVISTGLGLSLVRGLVESAHGQVDVHSVTGKGTSFTIRLPNLADAGPVTHSRPLLAIVDLADSRRSAIVTALLQGLHVQPRPYSPETAAGTDVSLWITRDPADPRVQAFAHASPERRVIVLGEPSKPVHMDGIGSQVQFLGPAIDAHALRVGLTAAVDTVLAARTRRTASARVSTPS